MRVMTCNVRTSNAPDGENGWPYRRDFCLEVIRSRTPDVLSLQEVSEPQFADFQSAFPDYTSHQLREGTRQNPPVNPIFYRRTAFELRSAGGYWLSASPHVSGTRSWSSILPRLATWAQLRELATGREVRVINTQLDVVGDLTRYRQAAVLAADTRGYSPDYPQLLTGDMNAYPDSAALMALESAGWKDVWPQVHPNVPSGSTYHAFAGSQYEGDAEDRIDYVFTRGAIVPTGVEIVRDCTLKGGYPSDHYFVVADVSFTAS